MAQKQAAQVPSALATAAAAGGVLAERPDYLKEGDNRGNERVGAADLIIPRLEIVQSLSPARKKQDPAYIEGAEEGMLYNSVSRVLYGTEAMVVLVYYRMEYQVWLDREEGGSGGFRGSFLTPDEAKDRVERVTSEEDKVAQIIDTGMHFALIKEPSGKWGEVVLSMNRSKQKVSKKINSLIRMAGGARFGRVFKITAVPEKNSKNQDFFNIGATLTGYPTKEVYDQAESVYKTLTGGRTVRADEKDLHDDEAQVGARNTEM